MAVSWVGGTDLVETTGTSVAATSPAGLADGDMLIAAVFARSTITPPSGWTLIGQTGTFTGGSTSQNLAAYRKNSTAAADASTSFTWSQSSSDALGVVYAAMRGADSSPTYAATTANNKDGDVTGQLTAYPMPTIAGNASGQMMIAFASCTHVDPAGGGSTGAIVSGWSEISLDPAGHLVGVYAAVGNGDPGPDEVLMDSDYDAAGITYGTGGLTILVDDGSPAVDVIVSADGPLTSSVALLGEVPVVCVSSADGPLGSPQMLGWHDISSAVNSAGSSYYLMDLVTPDGDVRVPISSWQATLQTGSAQYVACVVPNAGAWVDEITDATDFRISRRLTLTTGESLDYEIAQAPIDQIQYAQGGTNYSAVLSGYLDAAPDLSWPPYAARELSGIRTIFTSSSGMRVRCSIDWQLRPGQNATTGAATFVVAYINVSVSESDSYMDVGERSGAA